MNFNLAAFHKKYTLSILIMILGLGFMLTEIVEVNIVDSIVSFSILLFILLTLPKLRGTPAFISYGMIALGIVLLIGNANAYEIVMDGARINLTLVALFIMTPILGIPVRTGNYIQALKQLLVKTKNNVKFFYLSTTIMTHGLGFILNIGSVTINYHLTDTSNVRSTRLIANALNRGFTTSIYWSPYFAAMALMISQLHIKWGDIALLLFGFAILSILVSLLLELPYIKNEEKNMDVVTEVTSEIENKSAIWKALELLFLIVLMMAGVFLLQAFTDFGMTLSICIVSIILPAVWCLIRGDKKVYRKELSNHFLHTAPNLRQEITLFLTAGLFSAAYIQSPLSQQAVLLLNNYFGASTIMITLLFSFLIIATAIIGMHPIILVSIFATSIDPSLIGFTKEHFALVLLASWGLANTISPGTAVNNIIADAIKTDVLTVSVKWNWLYAVVMVLILPFYLLLIGF